MPDRLSYGPDSANAIANTTLAGVDGARAALETFYFALNNQDADVLEAVWAAELPSLLYNPLGGTTEGRSAIGELYGRLFESGRQVRVSFTAIVEYVGTDHAVFAGRETGSYLAADGTKVPLTIRTSRYFRYQAGAWRQCHHHGSIEDPDALSAYQKAVRG